MAGPPPRMSLRIAGRNGNSKSVCADVTSTRNRDRIERVSSMLFCRSKNEIVGSKVNIVGNSVGSDFFLIWSKSARPPVVNVMCVAYQCMFSYVILHFCKAREG
jgi:hypothetical protein